MTHLNLRRCDLLTKELEERARLIGGHGPGTRLPHCSYPSGTYVEVGVEVSAIKIEIGGQRLSGPLHRGLPLRGAPGSRRPLSVFSLLDAFDKLSDLVLGRRDLGLALGQLRYSVVLRPSSTELRFHLLEFSD